MVASSHVSQFPCSTIYENIKKEVQMDEFARNLAVQIPIQIAVGRNNKFLCLWNGEDDQANYKHFIFLCC